LLVKSSEGTGIFFVFLNPHIRSKEMCTLVVVAPEIAWGKCLLGVSHSVVHGFWEPLLR